MKFRTRPDRDIHEADKSKLNIDYPENDNKYDSKY